MKLVKKLTILSLLMVTALTVTFMTYQANAIEVGTTDYSVRDYALLTSSTVTNQTFNIFGDDVVIGGKKYYFASDFDNLEKVQIKLDSSILYMANFRNFYWKNGGINGDIDPFDSDFYIGGITLSTDSVSLQQYNDLDFFFNESEGTLWTIYPNYYQTDNEVYDVQLYSTLGNTSTIYVTVWIFYDSNDNTPTSVNNYLFDYMLYSLFVSPRYASNIAMESFPNLPTQEAYDLGYEEGYENGKQEWGYNNNGTIVTGQVAYNLARNLYGYFYMGNYQTATYWGILEYDRGYDDGLYIGAGLSQQEAFDAGYNAGVNDTFYTSLDAWVVPLAIVVAIASIGIVYLKWKPKTGE